MFGGREIGTSFAHGPQREPYNPDFAALARAHGIEGQKVSRSEDFCDVLQAALAANRPYVIDLEIDPAIRPPSIGTWELPPLPIPEPAFGQAWRPKVLVPSK
jgi:acetolactate synthase-1/2/3 large subunit